jgi:DNA-binding MarR family transcriptional regulator
MNDSKNCPLIYQSCRETSQKGKNLIFKPSEEMRDFRLLEELEKTPIVSQRELSNKFGIAIGVTNACLKRMIRRGWIRIRGLNQHRIGYFLTPKGLAEKARLTFHLMSYTVQHYSELKKVISERLLEIQREGLDRIVFYGVSDEMEVAYITLQGVDLKLVGIVEDDEKFESQILFGYEIEPVSRINELKPDCILITSLNESELKRKRLKTFLGTQRVTTKDICY